MEYTEEEIIGQFRYMIADFRETKNEITVTEEGINTLETLLNLIEKQQREIEIYQNRMSLISETCVDASKSHITEKEALEEIRGYIVSKSELEEECNGKRNKSIKK